MSVERRAPGVDRLVSTSAQLERIATGFGFTEGPLWTGDALLFSDIANSRIVRWRSLPEGPEVTTARHPSNLSNGLTFDARRRLIACEGATRRLTRLESDGTVTVLADRFEGRRLNSPNDVVVGGDGAIYFSDPFWGGMFRNPHGTTVRADDREIDAAAVYRLGTDGSLRQLASDFVFPNGLAFSPDGRTLYVDDSRRAHIRSFGVRADGSLEDRGVFAELAGTEPGGPDGMKVDVEGNVYCTGPGGVWIISPAGAVLGRILTPEVAANVGWGDGDWRTLYITARTSVYRLRMTIPGIPVP